MRPKRGVMFWLSIGSWGGIYFRRAFCTRLCLGWVAFTFVPLDDSELMNCANAGRDLALQQAKEGTNGNHR